MSGHDNSKECLAPSASAGCSLGMSRDRTQNLGYPAARQTFSESNAHSAIVSSCTSFCSVHSFCNVYVRAADRGVHPGAYTKSFTKQQLYHALEWIRPESLAWGGGWDWGQGRGREGDTYRTSSCGCIKSAGQPLLPNVKALQQAFISSRCYQPVGRRYA